MMVETLVRREGEGMARRVLIAEDSEQIRKQMKTLLEAEGAYQVDTAGDGLEALEMLEKQPYSFFLTDLRMPRLDGMKLIEKVRDKQLPVTVIVMTGHGSIDQAVSAIRLGAYDFLAKPIDMDHLRIVLERAGRERGLRDEVHHLREQLQGRFAFQNVLSKSPLMHGVFELIKNLADTTATVLIEGETGTGKEMIARAIHGASAPTRIGPLVAVNCAALPEQLLESELFGHEKGAFTGAAHQRKGRFEQAQGGTLFLDEVGDIPAPMQVKLLRVLQERRFERVGSTETLETDVRVVAATNRHLARLVRKGRFREDLFYRLNVVKIDLPPLRERPEDIPLLAEHFAAKFTRAGRNPLTVSPAAMEQLLQHSWPGNVRELENALERACVTARGDSIELADLKLEAMRQMEKPGGTGGRPIDLSRPLPDLLRESAMALEKQYLRRAMKRCRGHVGRCARMSGLSRRSISSKLAEYQIDKDEFKSADA
jgi:DNA-binding NtrC family response regulator